MFDRRVKSIHQTKEFFNKRCWKILVSTCRRMRLDTHFSPYTKINSTWIKDLNLKPQVLFKESS